MACIKQCFHFRVGFTNRNDDPMHSQCSVSWFLFVYGFILYIYALICINMEENESLYQCVPTSNDGDFILEDWKPQTQHLQLNRNYFFLKSHNLTCTLTHKTSQFCCLLRCSLKCTDKITSATGAIVIHPPYSKHRYLNQGHLHASPRHQQRTTPVFLNKQRKHQMSSKLLEDLKTCIAFQLHSRHNLNHFILLYFSHAHTPSHSAVTFNPGFECHAYCMKVAQALFWPLTCTPNLGVEENSDDDDD